MHPKNLKTDDTIWHSNALPLVASYRIMKTDKDLCINVYFSCFLPCAIAGGHSNGLQSLPYSWNFSGSLRKLPRKCLSGFSLLIWPPSANQLSCSILCTSLSLGAALSQFQCYEFWSESKLKPGLSPGAQDASLLVATDPLGATRPHNHWGHSLLQPSLRTGPVWAWLSHPLADGSPWAIRPADSEQSRALDTSNLNADHSLTTHPASHPPCDSHASSHLPVDVPSNGPLTSCSRSLRPATISWESWPCEAGRPGTCPFFFWSELAGVLCSKRQDQQPLHYCPVLWKLTQSERNSDFKQHLLVWPVCRTAQAGWSSPVDLWPLAC